MALTIKQVDNKWRLRIESEEWEFGQRQELEHAIHSLLDLKEKHGQLFKQQNKSVGGCMADYGVHKPGDEDCACIDCCTKGVYHGKQ